MVPKNLKMELHCSTNLSIELIKKAWLHVQSHSEQSVFLSWHWMGSWLTEINIPYKILIARENESPVAIGILFAKKRRILGIWPTTQWLLNRTGNRYFDQSWIEYNDFLVCSKNSAEIKKNIIKYLLQQPWDEFIQGMVSPENCNDLAKACLVETLVKDRGFSVALDRVNKYYTKEILSRNTRQKVNQSKKLLSIQGSLTFKVVTAPDEKLSLLDIIRQFHIDRWSDTETTSGFCNESFSAIFKGQLVSGVCEVAILCLSEKPIAILVNYRYQNKVSFYLSALSNQYSGKIKLGLLIHSLAIEHYKNCHIESYDFLAGESQYKRSLSNDIYEQNMFCFRKKTLINRIELILKMLKSFLIKKKNFLTKN